MRQFRIYDYGDRYTIQVFADWQYHQMWENVPGWYRWLWWAKVDLFLIRWLESYLDRREQRRKKRFREGGPLPY